ncbi:fumarylacetoacetase [Sneathiella sp.]|uniref:fumarylacetoacetase n=1 Tax=Sneathiella sp. TaxID=1964365 RepID=UPI003566A45C
MTSRNETHDPALVSWVAGANDPDTDFPIQNLPFGVVTPTSEDDPRIAVAIGDCVLDLRACFRAGLLEGIVESASEAVFEASVLNGLMAASPTVWSALRLRLSRALRYGSAEQAAFDACLLPMDRVTILLPARIGEFTDFYCSIEHATNGGKMSRPDNPLMPNFTTLPVAYNGRASSVVVSGTDVVRPRGQFMKNSTLVYAPTEMLDFELEVGIFIGGGNPQFQTIPLADVPDHFFGVCLLNDWSSRDVQGWEYQPLGPFLSKGFATSISGWVVTQEALVPYRVPARLRDPEHGAALDYLVDAENAAHGGIDLKLEVRLSTPAMQAAGDAPEVLTRTAFDTMYWTVLQMIAHHASNGCPLRPGDLFGSGTVSQYGERSQGCLSEITWRGKNPVMLQNGEERGYLLDGDELTMSGYCIADGARRIGLGNCTGKVLPSNPK